MFNFKDAKKIVDELEDAFLCLDRLILSDTDGVKIDKTLYLYTLDLMRSDISYLKGRIYEDEEKYEEWRLYRDEQIRQMESEQEL